MPVVVTGAAGFVGSAVVSHLLERNERVVAIDRLPVVRPGVSAVRADLCDGDPAVLAALLVGSGLARRPEGVGWGALWGMSMLCGIGFTMSLFIGALAFGEDAYDSLLAKKVGIFAGSLLSAAAGFLLLRLVLRRSPAD